MSPTFSSAVRVDRAIRVRYIFGWIIDATRVRFSLRRPCGHRVSRTVEGGLLLGHQELLDEPCAACKRARASKRVARSRRR
jgi:hypothetical protein